MGFFNWLKDVNPFAPNIGYATSIAIAVSHVLMGLLIFVLAPVSIPFLLIRAYRIHQRERKTQ
jgi:hypothetical protein